MVLWVGVVERMVIGIFMENRYILLMTLVKMFLTEADALVTVLKMPTLDWKIAIMRRSLVHLEYL